MEVQTPYTAPGGCSWPGFAPSAYATDLSPLPCTHPGRPRRVRATYIGDMKIAAAIASDSTQLVGLGRAPRVALATVEGDDITDMTIVDVQWDVLHGQQECNHDDPNHEHGAGGHGSHHARIVTFLRENAVDTVLAAHAGPPMVNTIQKMGLAFLTADGDVQDVLIAAAKVVQDA